MKDRHLYHLNLIWTGEPNNSKKERLYQVNIEGKPSLSGSADKIFHGDANLYNPEDMLLSSLSACHMMSYFYVCKQHKIEITAYQDNPVGTLHALCF